MSKLYGMVQGNGNKPKTAQASNGITTWVQTSLGRIEVVLASDGTFGVYAYPVASDGTEYVAGYSDVVTLALGNVNERKVINMTDSTHREYVDY